jgi:hypothetical protein
MDAVRLLWRSRLRRQWRAWLAVALLLGFGAGTALACLAGARRTASSFDRITTVARAPDVQTSHGLEPAEAEAIISGFTGVAEYSTVDGFVGFVEGLDPTLIKYFIGPWGKPLTHGLPVLREGRFPHPDRADEVLVAGVGAEKAGIEPGDEITVRLFGEELAEPVTKSLVVTGTAAHGGEVASDASQDRSAIYFSPAFTRANAASLQAWSSTSLVAAPGTDIDSELIPQVVAAGWAADEVVTETQSRVQHAIGPLTATLGLLGGLVLIATLVVVGQALARQSDAGREEGDVVRVIGFSPAQARAIDALTLLSVVLPGALLAVAVAVALSPLFPVGSLRRLEPDRGLSADLTLLVLGSLSVVIAVLVIGLISTRRSARPERPVAPPRLARLGAARPSVGAGVRLAVGSTNVERGRFWATVGFSSMALSLVVAGLAFVGALDRLSDEPVRYGVGWELTARNAFGEVPPDEVRALVAGDRDIEGVAAASLTQVLINGKMIVPALPVLPITAEIWPTVVDGATPRNDDEVLVGVAVLEELGAEVGDRVQLRASYAAASGPPPEVTIVGTAVFPSIELAGIDPTRLDNGLAMTWGRYRSLVAPEADELPDFTFFDLADGVDPQTVIDRYPDGMPDAAGFAPTEWLPSLAPAEVRETALAAGLIWGVIAFLGVTVVATIGHAAAATVRRRRGDYAVLKALGFQRRQLLSAVTWQSTVVVVLALLVGVPVGVALGRSAWRVFARLLGVIDTPVIPTLALVAVVVGALLAGALVAAGPGLRAARIPAAALHEQ